MAYSSGPPGPPGPSGPSGFLGSIFSALYTSGATDRVVQWLLFNVGIALVPLIATYIISVLDREPSQSGMWANLPAKELLIISTALTGDAIGSLVTSTFNKTIRLVIGGICVCLLIFTTILFSRTPEVPEEVSLASEVTFVEYSTPKLLEEMGKIDSSEPSSNNPPNQLLIISQRLFLASLALGVASKAIE